MTQKLLTAAIKNAAKKFPLYSQEGRKEEAVVLARFFTPASNMTWYVLEYDIERDEAFGVVVGQETEYGYFSINELQNLRQEISFFGRIAKIQAVERDVTVDPKKNTIGQLMREHKEETPSSWAA